MFVIPRLLGASIGSFAILQSLDSSTPIYTNSTISTCFGIDALNRSRFMGIRMSYGFNP